MEASFISSDFWFSALLCYIFSKKADCFQCPYNLQVSQNLLHYMFFRITVEKKNRNGNHIFSWLFESNHTLNISGYLTEYEEDKQEVLFCLFDPNLVMSCSC